MQPVVVIVGGPSGTGKSTMAEEISEWLRLPLLGRDMIKETLMDHLGSESPEESHELGSAAYGVMFRVLEQLLKARVGIVLESNFHPGYDEDHLSKTLVNTRAVQIYCEASREEIIRRFKERAKEGDRHPGHHDLNPATLKDLERSLDEDVYGPLDLPIPTLTVDTTSDYDPDWSTIQQFVREHTSS